MPTVRLRITPRGRALIRQFKPGTSCCPGAFLQTGPLDVVRVVFLEKHEVIRRRLADHSPEALEGHERIVADCKRRGLLK
jgi:hypothetical protein